MRFTRGVGLGLLVAACRPDGATQPAGETDPPPPATTPTPAPPPTAPAKVTSLSDLLAGLELVYAGAESVWVAQLGDLERACEAAGQPELLPAERAATLGAYAPGEPVAVVHPNGLARTTIATVGCEPPTDDDLGGFVVQLSDPVPGQVEIATGAPRLAFIGAMPHPEARLRARTDPTGDTAAVRTALVPVIEQQVRTLTGHCGDDSEPPATPTPAAIQRAAEAANLWTVRGPGGAHVLAVVEAEGVIIDCYGQPQVFAVLLDPQARPGPSWTTNNGIRIEGVSDLDGDGFDEVLLHLWWLEDGLEEIHLWFPGDGKWEHRALYVSDSP